MGSVPLTGSDLQARQGGLRSHLRAATSPAHAALDARLGALDFGELRDYALFLRAQSPVFAVEAALERAGVDAVLPDWPARRRTEALAANLAECGLDPLDTEPFHIRSAAEIFGCLYVLEGSRLGARVLLGRVKTGPVGFLTHGAGRRLWQSFLARLDELRPPQDDAGEMAAAACRTFRLFAEAADGVLPRRPAA